MYKLLIKLKSDNMLDPLIKSGVISPMHKIYLEMFEFYNNELKNFKKMQSYSNTADKFGYSEKRTREIISLLKH